MGLVEQELHSLTGLLAWIGGFESIRCLSTCMIFTCNIVETYG